MKRSLRRSDILTATAALVPSVALVGCGGSVPVSDGGGAGSSAGSVAPAGSAAPDTVTVAWTEAVTMLNPYRSTDNATNWIIT